MDAFLSWAILISAVLIIGLFVLVVKGPTPFDRLLAFNGINTQAILILLFIGVYAGRLAIFIDIAIGYAALSLVGSLAAAKYLTRKDHLA